MTVPGSIKKKKEEELQKLPIPCTVGTLCLPSLLLPDDCSTIFLIYKINTHMYIHIIIDINNRCNLNNKLKKLSICHLMK